MSKKKKAGNILVYGLMALLLAGLGGFGIRNFSGGSTAVASVGARDITAEQYYRALLQAVRAQEAAGATDLNLATLEAMGIPQQVRGQLAGEAALNDESDRIGLSVGDSEVARRVRETPAFAGVDGKFDRESYEYMLDRNGWSVAEFEKTVRDEAARQILQGAVVNGVATPAPMVSLIADWFGERRDVRWIGFTALPEDHALPTPTDEELTAYLTAHEADFTLPEMKRITYAWLTPDMLADTIEVDEEAVRALYQQRLDEFSVPERRLVERLAFGTSEEALAAKQAIDAGETDFAALVAARDLTLDDVDMGEVTRDDLGQAGDAVFGLAEPGVVGPFPSDLGPVLYRMNAILAAQETSFEDAAAELRHDAAIEQAAETIHDLASDYDDRLAGGATLEDLAAETEMELGTLDFWDGAEAAIADDPAFREAAAALTDGDFPEIILLDNGGVAAMRLDETLPPRAQTLDEVRDAATAGWEAERRQEALRTLAETAQAQLAVGGQLGDGGEAVETAEGITRSAALGTLPPELVEAVFKLDEGETALVDTLNGVLLVQLDKISPRDDDDPQLAQIEANLQSELAQSIAGDLMTYFTQAVLQTAGMQFDDAAMNSVHSQIFR